MTSVLSTAQSITSLPTINKFKGLIVGPTGSGKTSAALTIPGRKLVIDTDFRLARQSDPDIEVIQVAPDKARGLKPWTKICNILQELWALAEKKEDFPYDLVLWEGLSSLGNLAMDWSLEQTGSDRQKMATAPGGGPAQPHYGPQMNQMMNLIRQAVPLPCHVIFTGHIDLYEDKRTHKLHYYPKMVGKVRSDVASLFNESYEAFRKQKDGKLRFFMNTAGDADRMNFLKSTYNKPLGALWEDPVEMDLSEENPGLQKILKLAEERR